MPSLVMEDIFFFIALLLEIFYVAMFLLTISGQSFRFWPPPTARSWQFFVSWIVASLVAVIYIFLGILDFNSFTPFQFWDRLPIAVGCFIVGGALGAWAFLSFPFRTTIGLGDKLITKGPYRFTRNPQYIGDSLQILGYVFLTSSWKVGVIGLLGIVLNILAVFTEEPWLEKMFGEDYRVYKRRVPRFIGRCNWDAGRNYSA